MGKLVRMTAAVLAMLAATAASAVQLNDVPVGLGWTAEQVAQAGAAQMHQLMLRAEQGGLLGCRTECGRLARVFDRLVREARAQTAHSATLSWSLTVVRLQDIEAMAMPGGQLVISEPFVDRMLSSDDALAFVLAHEMAHSILEHERQALTFARLLLPRQVDRSVGDMYAEMDFNLGLLRAMEPVLQQGEYEADELGLLLASAAGFDPDGQLAFVRQACADAAPVALLATHPPACMRLKALQALKPLASRQRPAGVD